MGAFSIKLTGLRELQNQLQALADDSGEEGLGVKALAQAARAAFKPVLLEAQRLAPRDSGALADSLKLSTVKPKSGDTVVVVGIRIGKSSLGKPGELPPARRWHFEELGTSKSPAHPFLRPAMDSQAAGVAGALKTQIEISIRKAIAKRSR